jgi:hypothetical protein
VILGFRCDGLSLPHLLQYRVDFGNVLFGRQVLKELPQNVQVGGPSSASARLRWIGRTLRVAAIFSEDFSLKKVLRLFADAAAAAAQRNQRPGPMTVNAVVEDVGGKRQVVLRALAALHAAGDLWRFGRGTSKHPHQYFLPKRWGHAPKPQKGDQQATSRA